MKVSARVEQSLQALAQLAGAYGNGPVPLGQVAEEGGITLPFLEQLMLGLRRKGLVTSVRGVRGGYSLAKDPTQISVGDIMAAVEGPFVPPRNVWALVQKKVMDTLNSVTLADLCHPKPTGAGKRSPTRQPAEESTSMTATATQEKMTVIPDLQVTVERKEILKANSLEVKKGEVQPVMRPNGAGKSSLWWRKGCPKCGGDMYQDRLLGDEWELNCLQCGYVVPRAKAQTLELTTSRAKGDLAFTALHRQDGRMPR